MRIEKLDVVKLLVDERTDGWSIEAQVLGSSKMATTATSKNETLPSLKAQTRMIHLHFSYRNG